jgi:hypothetical protein
VTKNQLVEIMASVIRNPLSKTFAVFLNCPKLLETLHSEVLLVLVPSV